LADGKQRTFSPIAEGDAGLAPDKFHHRQKGPIMGKQLKQNEQFRTKFTERTPGSRFVETRYDSISAIVEFNMLVVTPDKRKLRVFGGGAFEEKDLQRIAEELTQLAHDFELSDAQAEGYMQAVEEADKGNE
jgi:hypothetical protein